MGLNGGMISGGMMQSGVGNSLSSGLAVGGLGGLGGLKGMNNMKSIFSNQYNGKVKFRDSYIFSVASNVVVDSETLLANSYATVTQDKFESLIGNGIILFSNAIDDNCVISIRNYENKKIHNYDELIRKTNSKIVTGFYTNLYTDILKLNI